MMKYQQIRRIGKGSFGIVFLIRSKSDGKEYVMKKMKLGSVSAKERNMAHSEVKLLSGLSHPGIVQYVESFIHKTSSEKFMIIIMEYCEQGDLNNFLKKQRGKRLTESQILDMFVHITIALQFVHGNCILHRDLKTQNIFIKNNLLKLGDFGISKVLSQTGSQALASTVIGTPYYMSPELFSNRPYDFKSDSWSLGCILYELATLKHAFDGRSINGLAAKICRGQYTALSSKYSKGMRSIVSKLLGKTASKRPSVSEILRNSFLAPRIGAYAYLMRKRYKAQQIRPQCWQNLVNQFKDLGLENLLQEADAKLEQSLKKTIATKVDTENLVQEEKYQMELKAQFKKVLSIRKKRKKSRVDRANNEKKIRRKQEKNRLKLHQMEQKKILEKKKKIQNIYAKHVQNRRATKAKKNTPGNIIKHVPSKQALDNQKEIIESHVLSELSDFDHKHGGLPASTITSAIVPEKANEPSTIQTNIRKKDKEVLQSLKRRRILLQRKLQQLQEKYKSPQRKKVTPKKPKLAKGKDMVSPEITPVKKKTEIKRKSPLLLAPVEVTPIKKKTPSKIQDRETPEKVVSELPFDLELTPSPKESKDVNKIRLRISRTITRNVIPMPGSGGSSANRYSAFGYGGNNHDLYEIQEESESDSSVMETILEETLKHRDRSLAQLRETISSRHDVNPGSKDDLESILADAGTPRMSSNTAEESISSDESDSPHEVTACIQERIRALRKKCKEGLGTTELFERFYELGKKYYAYQTGEGPSEAFDSQMEELRQAFKNMPDCRIWKFRHLVDQILFIENNM